MVEGLFLCIIEYTSYKDYHFVTFYYWLFIPGRHVTMKKSFIRVNTLQGKLVLIVGAADRRGPIRPTVVPLAL